MRKRVHQFVGFTDDSDEGSTFSEGFHGGNTHGFHSVTSKGDTGSKSVECGWRADFFLAVSARSVSLEGEEQIERFAAFQHPNRSALASLVYETSPQRRALCWLFNSK